MRTAWVVLALLAVLALGIFTGRVVIVDRDCQEDEVIVGTGAFDGHHWENYTCMNREDVQP